MGLGAKALDTMGRWTRLRPYTANNISLYGMRRSRTLSQLLEGIKAADADTMFHHLY